MNAPKRARIAQLELKDSKLFRQQCYIDGAWLDADDKSTIAVKNPADGAALGTVPKMGVAETRRAIAAANAAFPAWRAKTAKERSVILRRWFELMMANQEDLAQLMTAEQGKPLAESRGEIGYAASFIEWFAEEGKRIYGDTIPQHQADKRIVVLKEPIGVCVAITPWNFPSAMITRKAGPALAAGCTMVVKPASATPYSALAMAELAERAGVPKGVLSVVTGSAGAIGGEMSTNPTVRKLTFTGSTEIGKKLMAQCASTVKKTSMELGGNAPFIVFDDADLDAAVEGAMISKYRNNGQTCVCANRILVQEKVYDAFAAKLAEKVKTLKVGNGREAGVTTGPLINAAALISGPVVTPASLPLPTLSVFTFSASFAAKASYTFSCTRMRLAQTQVWPLLRYLEIIAPSTAASRSASSNTMKGALPPSSIEVFFTVLAHCAISFLPISVEPVKVSLRTSGLVLISPPMAEAEPVTTESTPLGTPARSASSAMARAE